VDFKHLNIENRDKIADNQPTRLLLELDAVSRHFHSGTNEVRAMNNVSLSVQRGEFLAIMGQSGSGKSTLMNILGCLDTPTSGTYRVADHDVCKLTMNELSSLRLKMFGFVFQRYQLLNNQTAIENVAMPSVYNHMPKAQRQARAIKLLQKLGLAGREHHKPAELSGGQQQRVSIARALINGAEVILADKPTGALDSTSGQQVLALLKQLNRDNGTTVVLITHDPEVASHADRIVQMKDGEIISDCGHIAEDDVENTVTLGLLKLETFPRIGIFTSLYLAVTSLQANLFRTLLTLLGIIIGVAAVVSMMAIGDGGKQQVLDRISAMGTNLLQISTGGRNIRSSGDIATLTMADADTLNSVPGVDLVAPDRESRSTFRQGAYDYSGRIRGCYSCLFSDA